MNISKFKHFIKSRNQSGNRSSGGLSVYINQNLAKGVSYILSENKNIIWCKLDKTYFNFQKDIYLGTVYLSPPNYERNSREDLMGHVAALVRSHAIGLLPFRLTKEQTTQTMDPSPKTIELLHYPGQ